MTEPSAAGNTERLRALLDAQLEEIRARVAERQAGLEELTRARRADSADDEHDPEGEPLSAQWSMRAGLLASAQEDLAQAERAFARLDAGTYGICTECHEPIPFEQLEIRPFRERCVACSD